MCDTFVALPDSTLDGSLIFGKNSDRPAGEIQDVVSFPARQHASGTTVRCTWRRIPQARETYAVILSKPRWMWGAEMGANECGVVIGNEAVWTNEPFADSGLLGMDLLRLGLERGATAGGALQVIVELMEEFGQGGNCAEHFAFTYHNSWLIADSNEAWVLETAGQYWAAERITGGTRSISNSLSIRGPGDLRHAALDGSGLEFAGRFSTGGGDYLSPLSREGRVRQLCRRHEGEFTQETAKAILRDHKAGICMHGDFETCGSQVSALGRKTHAHWFIEGPHPCRQNYRQSLV